MKKPSEHALWLYKNWPIHGIKVEHKQTGDDTAESFVTVASAAGTRKMPALEFDELCTLRRDYNSICDLKPSEKIKVTDWLAFENENKADLAEYERLRKKFETQ